MDIFPELFYFNDQNYYINGLDQTFMYEKDKELYKTWSGLVSGKTDPNETAKIIKEKFHSSYILLEKKDKKFAGLLTKSKFLEKVFEEETVIIYKIKNNE